MPPGRHGRGGPRRRMNGASITAVVNGNARTDEEIRRNVRRFFGSLLALILFVDVGSAFLVVWMSCGSTSSTSSTHSGDSGDNRQLQCVKESIFSLKAFHYNQYNNQHNDNKEDKLGDFVILAFLRCCLTLLLLWCGIRFGKERTTTTTTATPSTSSRSTTRVDDDDVITNNLTEPLLRAGHPDDDDGDGDNDNDNDNAMATSASASATTNEPLPDDETIETANGGIRTTSETATTSVASRPRRNSSFFWNPKRIKTFILLLVFVCCTLYQVYAGLRVATMEDGKNNNNNNNDNDDDHHHHRLLWTTTTIRTILLCATVLWINAEAYVTRVLIIELTRQEEGLLFLPPEIHRHPLYLETDRRSMSMHWCDLCRQRISSTTTTATAAAAATCRVATNTASSSPAAAAGGYCYRCALCDFDICLPCSRRNDAATVGENVLRGDRGVRQETSLTTSDYVKRSIAVAGKSEWPWLVTSFVLLAISSLSKLFLPHFQGKIIDKVIPIPYHNGNGNGNGNDDDGNHDNDGDNDDGTYYDKKGFLHYITIYIFVMLAQGAVSTLYSAIFTLVSRRLKFVIRNALLEKILAQDVAYFDGTESGRLISRLTNDLDMMMAPIQSSLSNLLSNCLILVGGMVMCFVKSYRLSMLAFVTVGPISYLWEQYALWSKGLAREMLSYWAEGNSIAAQALSHIRTVKAFGCEEVVLRKYSETNRMALNCGVKDAWGNGVTSALTGYLDLGTGVLILYFGGLLVYRGEMSVGDLVTYQLFWNMMNNAYQSLQGLVTSFTRSAAGAEKVFSLWDSDPDIDPQKGNDISEDQVGGHLQMKNVSFYYQMRPDNMVLDGFNLEIPAGKTIALVGRSGGGKSTIINLLLRFYDPRQGMLLLDGKPYESLKVNQLRRLFGVVTQDTELFALTVEENIAYGLDKDDYKFEEVVAAAKKAYAHDFICEMKDGYQTRIGERGGRISGGQRQRLAIARVFLRRPRIILLDEATSALDENSQEAVQRALADLIQESNATVVMVAHRLSTVVNADSICVIDKGRVLEQGSHDELASKSGGIYAAMVSKQLTKKVDILDQEQEQEQGQNNTFQTSSSHKAKNGGQRQVAADTIDALLADES